MKRKLKRYALIALGTFAAIFAVWRLHLAFSVGRHLAALRAAGLPTSGEELNRWWHELPAAENAAVLMQEAFDLQLEFPRERAQQWSGFRLPPRNQHLTEEQKQFLSDYVDLNAVALAKASEAVQLPRCRYPMDLSWGANTPLPHLTELRGLTRRSEYEAVLALEANQPSLAAASISRILGMARTLDDEPLFISQLTRCSMLSIAFAVLQRDGAVIGLDETQLADLQFQFTTVEKTGLVSRAMIGERATLLPYFRMSREEARRLSDASESGANVTGPPLRGRQSWLMLVSGFFERDLLFYLRIMETNISLTSLPPPRSLAAQEIMDQATEKAKRRLYLLSSMTLPGLARASGREADCLARVRAAIAALAVERFRRANGILPRRLDELVPQFLPTVPSDPFDGQPLRYCVLPKGYLIYSAGNDGRDNGGRERPVPVKSGDKSDYDVTFTVEQ